MNPEERGDKIADTLDLVCIRTIGDAIRHVRDRMPNATDAEIVAAAMQVRRRAHQYMQQFLA